MPEASPGSEKMSPESESVLWTTALARGRVTRVRRFVRLRNGSYTSLRRGVRSSRSAVATLTPID